jgi:eukaryotic-like serine/threonine-protein kinase
MIGEQLGNYRVLTKLGEGGMGQVFIAEHVLLGKRAAIKVLLPELSQHGDFVTRFFNEARAASMVKHAGLVDIYDFGKHASGSAFIVMELLDGESLAGRLRRERALPEPEALEIARQIAGALEATHRKGIVHRDLKPDNVFLVPDENVPGGCRVKILDFGIAKLSDGPATGTKTRTGAVMGTPTYMAPEQCRGAGSVDHRADVYSLGCMIFEMLAGQPPFVREGIGDLIAAHIHEAPPLLQERVGVSPAVASLVAAMLAKKAEERVSTMADVLTALGGTVARATGAHARYETGPQRAVTTLGGAVGQVSGVGATSPAAARPSRRAVVVAAALTAVAAITAGVWWRARAPGDAQHAQAARSAPEREPGETPAPATAAAAATAPATAPSPTPRPAAAAPEYVTVAIRTTPAGASVFRDGDDADLGTTPFTTRLERGGGEAVFVLRMSGYAERRVALDTKFDSETTIRLEKPRPRSAAHAHSAAAGEKPAAAAPAPATPRAPIKNGTIDPFQ